MSKTFSNLSTILDQFYSKFIPLWLILSCALKINTLLKILSCTTKRQMQASTHKTYYYCACSCHMINKSSKRSNGSATKLSIPIRLVFSILNLHLLLCAYFLMISECIHATYICIQKLLLSMSMSFVFSGGGRSHGHVILTFLMIYQCNNKYVCQVGRYVGQKAYHLF